MDADLKHDKETAIILHRKENKLRPVISVGEATKAIKLAQNGGVADEDLRAVCFAYSELSEVDKLPIARMAIMIASMCDNVSIISALMLIHEAERYSGMRDGRYPKTEFYRDNERLPFYRSDKTRMLRDDQIFVSNDF